MSDPRFTVSSRSVGHGKSMQVTIPAAVARKLPQGKSIRWELTVVEDGLHYRYLGQEEPINVTPDVEVPWMNDDV